MQLSRPSSVLLSPCCHFLKPNTIAVILHHPNRTRSSWRNYATHTHDAHNSQSSSHQHQHQSRQNDTGNSQHNATPDIPWPSKSLWFMTPYEIFNISKDAPYPKHTFYQLVKMYHPDRPSCPASQTLSKTERMERFRLVVAANEILCDPVKRKAYDQFGAGWTDNKDVKGKKEEANSTGPTRSRRYDNMTAEEAASAFAAWSWKYSYKNSKSFDDSPVGNATWEDWEKWYNRYEPKPPPPPLTKNTSFLTLVILFGFVGVLTQVSRLENHSASLMDGAERQHGSLSRDLSRMEKEMVMYNSRNERIQTFLNSRGFNDYTPALPADHKVPRLPPPGPPRPATGTGSSRQD